MNAPDTDPKTPLSLAEEEAEASFLSRWSRRKQAIARGETPAEPPPPSVAAAPAAQPEPALPDPLTLGMADDFSAFLRDKVPPALKHKAMQHLFSHPHFNELDMMDVYMEDFNLVPNLEPASMDLVRHAKAVLDPTPHEAREAPDEAADGGPTDGELLAGQAIAEAPADDADSVDVSEGEDPLPVEQTTQPDRPA